jgi:hypothetical protein
MNRNRDMNLLTIEQRDHAAMIIGTRLITRQDLGLDTANERYHVAESLAETLERLPVEEYVLAPDRSLRGKVSLHCADGARYARSIADLAAAVRDLELRSGKSFAGACVSELLIRRPDIAEFEVSATSTFSASDGAFHMVDVCNVFDDLGADVELTEGEVDALIGDNAYLFYRAICGTDEPVPGTTSIVVRREAIAQHLADALRIAAGVPGGSIWSAFEADAQAQQQGNSERPRERG